MQAWQAALLSLVEGLTEFLPISSTGHLIVASRLLGLEGELSDAFNVAIQSGAIAAVLLLYWPRFRGLLHLRGRGPLEGGQGWLKLGLTTAPPLVLAFFFEKPIKAALFDPTPVALAWALGGAAILWIDREGAPRRAGFKALTPRLALLIGLCQCLSLWPGISRSGAVLLGAMALGLGRKEATEYSFLAAVPILFAATAHELVFHYQALSGSAGLLALGWLGAFASAWACLRLFTGFVASHRLAPFGWYRLVAAPLVWWLAR